MLDLHYRERAFRALHGTGYFKQGFLSFPLNPRLILSGKESFKLFKGRDILIKAFLAFPLNARFILSGRSVLSSSRDGIS
jgi:hypothetical protein